MELRTQQKQSEKTLGNNIDAQLQEEFLLGAMKFANNPLHQKLKSKDKIQNKLKFVPKMLYFILGFKDLMTAVRYENPKNPIEEGVNIHSDEDSGHWEWYLHDLAFISAEFKNANSEELINEIWDDSTYEVRQTVYLFSRYIQSYTDPVARMLMIEVLEITFDEFKLAIHPVLKEADLYEQLDFFGKKHHEMEENHTAGTGHDDIAKLITKLPDDLKGEMKVIIKELFDQMYNMASNWSKELS